MQLSLSINSCLFGLVVLLGGLTAVSKAAGQGPVPPARENLSATTIRVQIQSQNVLLLKVQKLLQEYDRTEGQKYPVSQRDNSNLTVGLRYLEQALDIQRRLFGQENLGVIFLLDLTTAVEQLRGDWSLITPPNRSLPVKLTLIFTDLDTRCRTLGLSRRAFRDRLQQCNQWRAEQLGQEHPWVHVGQLDQFLTTLPDPRSADHRKSLAAIVPAATSAEKDRSYWRFSTPLQGCRLTACALAAENALRHNASAARECLDRAAGLHPSGFEKVQQNSLLVRMTLREGGKLTTPPDLQTAWGIFGNAATHFSRAEQLRTGQLMRRLVLDPYLSYLRRQGRQDREVTIPVFLYGLGISPWKGSTFLSQRRLNLERRHPQLAPLFTELEEVQQQLARLTATGTVPAAGESKDLLETLQTKKHHIEIALRQRRSRLPQYMPSAPTLQLGSAEVLLDYYEYEDVAGVRGVPEHRLACIVARNRNKDGRKQAEQVFVDLGPLAPVAQAITDWRRNIRRGTPGDEPLSPQRVLRQRLWEPLARYLEPTDQVIISPDGDLAFVPFAALPGAKPGTYLLEERGLVVAPVPQLLQPLKSMIEATSWGKGLVPRRPEQNRLLLLGGVDFSAPPGPDLGATGKATSPRSETLPHFPLLPGTVTEIQRIEQGFRERFPNEPVVTLRGAQATEKAFRQEAPACRWLHLATHGFFRSQISDIASAEVASGLALAGANQAPQRGQDDGVLTALEVASLDFYPVELTVLSACETGLGETVRGEGVLGLQSAFLAAGSKTVISTLWQIDDTATQVLMSRFYNNLWTRELSRFEALREAQLWMLREGRTHPGVQRGMVRQDAPQPEKSGRLPPYYWAAFVLSGSQR